MDREQSWQVIEQERRTLADLLETLTEQEWATPSLCAGWRVRDVAAHLALGAQPPAVLGMVTAALRAGGRFHKLNRDFAIRYADSGVDLVSVLREQAGSRHLPPVTSHRNILFDVLVHGQDIAMPIGRERRMPVDAAAAGADRVWTMGWPFWAKHRLRGVRLVATDVPWAVGSGEDPVEGPIDALLLLLTGRTVALDRLSGPGLSRVR